MIELSAKSEKQASKSSGAHKTKSTRKRTTTKNEKTGRGKRAAVDVEQAFRKELADVTDAETQLTKFVSTFKEHCNNYALEESLTYLERASESYLRSLERVKEAHAEKKPGRATRCEPARALVREGTKHLSRGAPSFESDLLAITTLQKLVHYGIASYGSLCAWSAMIGDEDAILLFRRLTDERKEVDADLTEIAESALWRDDHRNGA